jgi:uncharacterized repeat protein (TIGR03803 family)
MSMSTAPFLSCRMRANFRYAMKAAVLSLLFSMCADAQTFTVIHSFTGGNDGGNPTAGVTLDGGGNLYGTTSVGGAGACGTVFKLQHRNSVWVLSNLYSFHGSDGCSPTTKVVWGPNSAAYSTTLYGGTLNMGTVFELRPSTNVCTAVSCPWNETILYSFVGTPNAEYPGGDPVAFDSSGNLFGATWSGGGTMCNDSTCGTVYELSPSQGGWSETLAWSFPTNGVGLPNGVIVGTDGNLYGTTYLGGSIGVGTIFELSRNNGWAFTNHYSFDGNPGGGSPYAGLIADSAGTFYGGASWGGANQAGTVYSLSSAGSFSTLATFTNPGSSGIFIGPGPAAKLMMDSAGNLYGTTYSDGAYGYGSVFKLTRSGNSYTLTTLHDFTGGSDGAYPISDVVMDASGNLYGTSTGALNSGSCHNGVACGVVWEITP